MLYYGSSLSILYIVGVTEFKGFGAGREPEDLSPGPRSAANLLCILERLLNFLKFLVSSIKWAPVSLSYLLHNCIEAPMD